MAIITITKPFFEKVSLPIQIRDGLREISYGASKDSEQEDLKQNHERNYVRRLTEPAWNPLIDC